MSATIEQCDVLIVGGGPAGSACAWQLRRHGADVLLIDKARFPRDKVCAGWITPQVIDSLAIDLDEFAKHRVLQPLTGFRVGRIGHSSVNVSGDSVLSYGIRRCEFDEYLLRRSGARVREGESVSSIEREPNGWLINGKYKADVLIGAAGHFCPVRRWLRDQQPTSADANTKELVVAAQEVEFEMTHSERSACAVDPCVPELYFYPDLMGYAWCFRKADVLNMGLGRLGERNLRQYREQLLDWLISSGRIGRRPDQRFKGHAYRLNTQPADHHVSDRLLLIGDAAGLAAPRSGEGIRPAIESGLLAADVVAAASGDFRVESLELFTTRLNERFRHVAMSLEPASAFRRLLAGWLLTRRWFVRRVVLDNWFLNRSLPAYQSANHSPHESVTAPAIAKTEQVPVVGQSK